MMSQFDVTRFYDVISATRFPNSGIADPYFFCSGFAHKHNPNRYKSFRGKAEILQLNYFSRQLFFYCHIFGKSNLYQISNKKLSETRSLPIYTSST